MLGIVNLLCKFNPKCLALNRHLWKYPRDRQLGTSLSGLNGAELILGWNLRKTCFGGIPQKEFRALQHCSERQYRNILKEVLIALMAGFQVVIRNPFAEVMNVMKANAGRKPLQ